MSGWLLSLDVFSPVNWLDKSKGIYNLMKDGKMLLEKMDNT